MSYAEDLQIKKIIKGAFSEDLGKRDITTELFIPKTKYAKAILLAKENCIVCGLHIARSAFRLKDRKIKFMPLVRDGQEVRKGRILAKLQGKAQSILTAERVALNFLCFLSGIATKTREFVDKVKPYKVKIMDTRKTIPLLRELQKYAVRIGGGYNHRMRLDEMILIKDNHLKVTNGSQGLGGLTRARGYLVELEVKNLKELKEALKLKPDIIMLDNMSIKDIRKALKLRSKLSASIYHTLPKLEASGGITLKTVERIASCGVEIISVGELTDSVKSSDISLEIL